jgi:hypothetical protein
MIRTDQSTRPKKEHTEIEEELHDKAHIDYDRVAIVRPAHVLTSTAPY